LKWSFSWCSFLVRLH